jgi:hypothetical protein
VQNKVTQRLHATVLVQLIQMYENLHNFIKNFFKNCFQGSNQNQVVYRMKSSGLKKHPRVSTNLKE